MPGRPHGSERDDRVEVYVDDRAFRGRGGKPVAADGFDQQCRPPVELRLKRHDDPLELGQHRRVHLSGQLVDERLNTGVHAVARHERSARAAAVVPTNHKVLCEREDLLFGELEQAFEGRVHGGGDGHLLQVQATGEWLRRLDVELLAAATRARPRASRRSNGQATLTPKTGGQVCAPDEREVPL